LYERTSSQESVNASRQYPFTHKNQQIENLSPISDALYQHVLKTAIPAGHVRAQSLVRDPISPLPADLGWNKGGCKWEVRTDSGFLPLS